MSNNEHRFQIKRRGNLLSDLKGLLVKYLIVSLLLINSAALTPNRALAQQRRIVTVTADQPNVWTLEQAHYLLAQMHRRNLDLKAKGLNPLDANEINGINIDVLRSLLEVGAAYNEADRFNNNLVKDDKNFDAERRRKLIQDLDGLQNESIDLTRVIARLKREKETAESDDEKARIEAEILEKIEVKAAVDRQIELKNAELAKLSPASGNVAGTSSSAAFDAKKFPAGGFDETFRKKAAEIIDGFKTNPQLNASLQLDNFLQLQYEIVSKQLTLLRDEVGPGEQLIFLELPQSINATHDKSDDMWAQSRWRIAGFTRCELKINNQSVGCHKIIDPAAANRNQNRSPRTTLDVFDAVTSGATSVFDVSKISLFDIQNRRRLATRFVNFGKNDSNEETVFQRLMLMQSPVPANVESAKQTYIKALTDVESLQKKYEDLNAEFARRCRENPAVCANEAEKEIVASAKKAVEQNEENVENPPAILLNHILKVLNAAIEVPVQLNNDVNLNIRNQSRRTLILERVKDADAETKKLLNRLWIEDLLPEEIRPLREDDFTTQYVDLSADRKVGTINDLVINNRVVRTVEMIPRQSSFNVNDVKIRNKAGAFNFIASFLFGFGANVNYQRQRERYSQFVQQELYSSAFGKGSREFGWTFTSMPGTDKLLSGLRTTYAIAIVPQEATSIVLQATGCAFDRTANQPEDFVEATNNSWTKAGKNSCTAAKNFVVTIPGGGYDANNDFFVNGLAYEPVEKNKRIVVSIYGNNFSSQMGVMVNGVSLPASIGLAQRFILDDSRVGEKVSDALAKDAVRGSFERVDANQIVAAFEMPEGKDGTPVITLVSPGKAVDLNALSNLYINGERNKRLNEAKWMFGDKPKSDFKIKDVQLFVSDTQSGAVTELTALITGSSFSSVSNVFVNGVDPAECAKGKREKDGSCRSENIIGERGYWGQFNVYRIKFPPPQDDKIHIVLVSGADAYKIEPIANPAKAQKTKEPTKYKPNELSFTVGETRAVFADSKQEKVAYLLAEIQGVGLTSSLTASIGQLDVVNENKAFITITDPKPAQTVRLNDAKNERYAEGVIVMPKLPAPTPKPSATQAQSPNP